MDRDLEIELLKFQVENLTVGLNLICNELIQAGMSGYNPEHNEMIQMGKWGIEIPNALGLDKT